MSVLGGTKNNLTQQLATAMHGNVQSRRIKPEMYSDEHPSISHARVQHNKGGSINTFLPSCASPQCGTGWLHLWRSRSGPIFEGGWSCSATCTAARIADAVRREMDGSGGEATRHNHRVPLGLVLLEQGWISAEQLRRGLEAQKAAGYGRLGAWLKAQGEVSEQHVSRALGLQWSCPVLSLEFHQAELMAPVLPRLFVEAYGALPLRQAAGTILYLGFEERLDPVVALAIERMLGLRVESGVIQDAEFRSAQQQLLQADFPHAELVEVASEAPLVRVLARALERVKPIESRLVRLHDCLWLRMWTKPQSGILPEVGTVQDVICSLAVG